MTPRRRWLDEGLDLLASSGFNGVTIEALCERLGLSKGSFYHHFKGMPGYQIALLEHFEERETQAFIDLVESLPTTDGAKRLRALTKAVVADEAHDALEPQFRIWASQDQVAREYLERIDRTRTEYLQRQCRAIVDDVDLADDVATMIYLIMIGASHIVPQILVRDQARMWDRLINHLETQSDRREA